VNLEASTKPHVHQKLEIFWIDIASIMACPNFKNGPKDGLRPLGINLSICEKAEWTWHVHFLWNQCYSKKLITIISVFHHQICYPFE
jgi:hypothetical protein